MKFNPMYRIEYGYFVKQRFEGTLKFVEATGLESKQISSYRSNTGTQLQYNVMKTTDEVVIQELLNSIDPKTTINYEFTIENGVLLELIEDIYDNTKKFTLITHLNTIKQNIFLRHIFKMFGTYLAVFIKDHDYALTSQEYILNEFKDILEAHSNYTTTCGDYTFIRGKSPSDYYDLAIEGDFDRNTRNELDQRKGITLFIYMDDVNKKEPLDDNFTVNDETVKRFAEINSSQAHLCNYVVSSLRKAGKEFDLLYDYTIDYLEESQKPAPQK